jgi:hypothetical protein
VLDHLLVAVAAAPLQLALGAVNARSRWFTMGEVRFWGLVLFMAAELLYLGLS